MKINLDTKLKKRLQIDETTLKEFCEKNHIAQLGLFGSVLRDDFNTETSDVDVLVRFNKDFKIGLIAFIGIELELGDLLHRKVDLASWEAIEEARNLRRRKIILESAKVIYDSAG